MGSTVSLETGWGWRLRAAAGITVVVIVLAALCDKAIQIARQKWANNQVAAKPVAPGGALSQSFTSNLITVHYPADFAAKALNEEVFSVSRSLPDGEADVLTFMAIANPISQDNDEYLRVVTQADSEKPSEWEYREVSKGKVTCNGMPGMERVGTWKPAGTHARSRRRWCAFLRDGHGYGFSYSIPEHLATDHEQLLRSIIEATTFKKP